MVDVIKTSYFGKLTDYYSKQIFSGPWTRKWCADIINMLNNKNEIIEANTYQTFVQDKYTVISNDDTYQLMRLLKSNRGDFVAVPVVPWEDSFDIIWEAHIACGHGDITQTINLIKSKHFLNIKFVEALISICNCQSLQKPRSNLGYNTKGSIQILDMTSCPDEAYKYILTYIDIGTGFAQLKPLKEMNELEVALELVDIFSDLGPPRTIVVFEPYFYDNVMESVNKVFSPCNIKLDYLSYDCSKSLNKRACQIGSKLHRLMSESKCSSWKVLCNIVQLQINFIPYENKIPHQLVFGDKCDIPNFNEKPNVDWTVTPSSSLVVLDNNNDKSPVLKKCDPISTLAKDVVDLNQQIDNTMVDCDSNQLNESLDPTGNIIYVDIGTPGVDTNLVKNEESFINETDQLESGMNSASSCNTIDNTYTPDVTVLTDPAVVDDSPAEVAKDRYSEFDNDAILTPIKIDILSTDEDSNSD